MNDEKEVEDEVAVEETVEVTTEAEEVESEESCVECKFKTTLNDYVQIKYNDVL